ncbi:abscisic acid-deficient protein Aba4 family protein [Jannaschia marina]|uniref:abscisic acid-deficient protein Aba4 family protein n=1 Tax=Jannaschia marina TaxID=2741674 RepID=UPI0015CE60D3|nr:abscisic acid-deficient protein Aba4 family protein [Jannaschia marina]
MTPDLIFTLSFLLALVGWLALAFAPLAPARLAPVGGIFVPALLALAYAVTAAVYFPGAPGGLDSLANALVFFTLPGTVLAGWIHYLAFDLFVGGWILRDGRRRGVPHWAILPALLLTCLLGPVGFLLHLALRRAIGHAPG